MRSSLLVLAAAVAAPLAPIAITPAAATVAQEDAARDQEVVCRRGQLTTSRMGTSTRVCRTRAEWRAMNRQAQRVAGDESHSGTTRTNSPGSASQDF